jgi:hypothetical protein
VPCPPVAADPASDVLASPLAALTATPIAAQPSPEPELVHEQTVFGPEATWRWQLMSISEKASSNSKTAVPLSVVVPTALSVVQIDTTISPDAVSATVTLGFAVVLLVAVWVPS